MSRRVAVQEVVSAFPFGFAESHIELDGTAWNNSIASAFFFTLGSIARSKFSTASRVQERSGILELSVLKISQPLLFICTFQQSDHIADIESVIGTNFEPKSTAFLIQLRYMVVPPLSARNNGNISRSQESLQREFESHVNT